MDYYFGGVKQNYYIFFALLQISYFVSYAKMENCGWKNGNQNKKAIILGIIL